MEGRKTTVRVGRATKKPNRILADDAYWNVPFLKRYLNRCDEIAVHEPKKAYEMAAPVVALADTRIRIGGRPGAYKSARERRSYRVHARIVRASTAKDVGEFAEAQTLYADAFKLAEEPIDTNIKARLYTRYAWLLFAQGNAKALKEAKTAIELEADAVTLAAAYIIRGAVADRFEDQREGLQYFAKAASLTKGKRTTKRGQRVFHAALHGVAKVLGDCCPMPDTQRKAYLLLQEVKGYLAGRPKSISKMLVYWQMGRIAWNLGYDRHGPRLIRKARNGLQDLGDPFEFALCSLDLAGVYLEMGTLKEYDALVAETYASFEKLENPELLKALSLLLRDVRMSAKELRTTRQAVEALKDGGQ